MIRVYLLPVETIDGTEQVAGIEYIHDALLDCTENPLERELIQDTTDFEHVRLVYAGAFYRDPTQEEIDRFNARPPIPPPDLNVVRAKELLSTSPSVITMPEMWELMRIFGRLLGIPD
ncbi:hypothetical protein ES703_112097 [subsurface metagenome]